MLKRHQILLDDWMADFLKYRARQFDISLSEVIRMVLCLYHIMFINKECEKLSFDETIEKNVAMAKKWLNSTDKKDREEMQKVMSDTYYNARKAIECFMDKESKAQVCPKKAK